MPKAQAPPPPATTRAFLSKPAASPTALGNFSPNASTGFNRSARRDWFHRSKTRQSGASAPEQRHAHRRQFMRVLGIPSEQGAPKNLLVNLTHGAPRLKIPLQKASAAGTLNARTPKRFSVETGSLSNRLPTVCFFVLVFSTSPRTLRQKSHPFLFTMAKATSTLDWTVVRLGEDHNWWVAETSDPVRWDVDGL